MNWNELLTPLYGLILTAITTLVLNKLRQYLETKKGIAISDDQFEIAKRVVQAVEEKALTGRLSGTKKETAVKDLIAARPDILPETADRKIDQAVAVLPNVGATGKACSVATP